MNLLIQTENKVLEYFTPRIAGAKSNAEKRRLKFIRDQSIKALKNNSSSRLA